jgi:outer membrane protein TolC
VTPRVAKSWFGSAIGGLALLILETRSAEAAEHLTAEEVLASSAVHYPSIIESLARRRGAAGKVVETDGAFDLVFTADGFGRLAGFYDGSAVQGGVKQEIGRLGARLYADYQLSDGRFPLYEDSRYTTDRGAVSVGALFSLLRDRDIDDRRFARADAGLALQAADLEVLLTRLGVQQRAAIAYWRWVTAGRTLEVYRNLLELARDRVTGLEAQVRSGAQASIFLVENRQNITRRETFVASAVRELRIAANELSLYYRDADGRPRVPDDSELPPMPSLAAGPLEPRPSIADASTALTRRPELEILRTAIARAQQRVALAANAMKPRVDVNVELGRALGSAAEGGPSRDSSDARIGVSFSVPLQQRAARGRLQQERAAIDAIAAEQRLRREQIEVEVENIVLELDIAEQLLKLAADQVEQTELVRAAEQRRFENGASDFFVVNLREETAANARIQHFAADLDRRVARINYDAATVDLQRLGLDAAE